MPRRVSRANTEGQDAFLDILFNIIGIMVLIVAFAALASATTSQVQNVYMGVKGETQKKMLNIICSDNRCVQLDHNDQKQIDNNFSVRIEGIRRLISPLTGADGWISLDEIINENALEEYFVIKAPEVYDISMLIYQNSFQIAARVEEIGRKRGYSFRHVFFEDGEPISIERQKVYVN